MSALLDQLTDRRGFLVAGARGMALIALSALVLFQEAKRRRLANDPDCIRISPCSDCAQLGHCTKPKAKDARRQGAIPPASTS